MKFKYTFTDLMIDFETLGSEAGNSLVFEMAAVPFHLEQYDNNVYNPETHFHANISIDSALRSHFVIEESTLNFWMSQNKEISLPLFNKSLNGQPVSKVVTDFYEYFQNFNLDTLRLWAKGFDIQFLKTHLRHFGYIRPWDFRNEKDVRTYLSVWPIDDIPRKEREEHNGIADCRYQILQVKQVYHKLKTAMDAVKTLKNDL